MKKAKITIEAGYGGRPCYTIRVDGEMVARPHFDVNIRPLLEKLLKKLSQRDI